MLGAGIEHCRRLQEAASTRKSTTGQGSPPSASGRVMDHVWKRDSYIRAPSISALSVGSLPSMVGSTLSNTSDGVLEHEQATAAASASNSGNWNDSTTPLHHPCAVMESHHHLSNLLDEMVRLKQANDNCAEELLQMTKDRNALKIENERLNQTLSSSELPTNELKEMVEALRQENAALVGINDNLSHENSRLVSERNSQTYQGGASVSEKSLGDLSTAPHTLPPEGYEELFDEVATLRAANREIEAENQEMSNDLHDIMRDVDELTADLQGKTEVIASLEQERDAIAKERDEIAEKLWAQREQVIDTSDLEQMVENVRQQERLKYQYAVNDKALLEDKLDAVIGERDNLNLRLDTVLDELEAKKRQVHDLKKHATKWKKVAGVVSSDTSNKRNARISRRHTGTRSVQGGRSGTDYEDNCDLDDDDDGNVSVCTAKTYHVTTQMEDRRRAMAALKEESQARRRPLDFARSARSLGSSIRATTVQEVKSALSLGGFIDDTQQHQPGHLCNPARVSNLAQSSSSLLRSRAPAKNNYYRSDSQREIPDDDDDNSSILMYPSLGGLVS